jgi:hypothetical protein
MTQLNKREERSLQPQHFLSAQLLRLSPGIASPRLLAEPPLYRATPRLFLYIGGSTNNQISADPYGKTKPTQPPRDVPINFLHLPRELRDQVYHALWGHTPLQQGPL